MMLGTILDVAIGMTFIYVLLSLIASGVQEMIASVFKWRGTYLSKAIDVIISNDADETFAFKDWSDWFRAYLTPSAAKTAAQVKAAAAQSGAPPVDPTLQKVLDIHKHPLIRNTPSSLPSYLPSRNFALALLEVLRDGSGAPLFSQAERTIAALPNGDLKTTLNLYIQDAAGDLDAFRKHLENWFDDAMDRVGGLYKRLSQWVLLIVGLLLAAALNVDSLHVAKVLWTNPAMTQALVAEAAKASDKDLTDLAKCPASNNEPAKAGAGQSNVPANTLCQLKNFQDDQNIPLGWRGSHGLSVLTVLGWILTGLAVSLGAPFWFDLLKNLMNVRSSGVVPARTGQEAPPAK